MHISVNIYAMLAFDMQVRLVSGLHSVLDSHTMFTHSNLNKPTHSNLNKPTHRSLQDHSDRSIKVGTSTPRRIHERVYLASQ